MKKRCALRSAGIGVGCAAGTQYAGDDSFIAEDFACFLVPLRRLWNDVLAFFARLRMEFADDLDDVVFLHGAKVRTVYAQQGFELPEPVGFIHEYEALGH